MARELAMRNDVPHECWGRSPAHAVPGRDRDAAVMRPFDVIEHAPQRHALLVMLAAALDGVPRPEPRLDEQIDWAALIATAKAGRLLTHICHGAALCGIEVPPMLRDAGRAFRERSLLVNSVNLSTIQRVSAAFERSGLDFAVIKGPLQLQRLYGDYFVRPSSDIDLLVDRRDYDHAARLLHTIGYEEAARCKSRWWRYYLGEQHFLAADRTLATVDLHHRVQQPGCPAPRDLASYVGGASRVALGHAEVRVLSDIHACLLSAISFVKAVYHREQSMRYLCDLALMLRMMDEAELQRLEQTARAQGMCNLLSFAWQSAAGLLPMALPPAPQRNAAPLLEHAGLAAIALMPECAAIRWPKRRELLWYLCDPKGVLGRLGRYSEEAAFAAAAELSRIRNE